MTIYWLVLVYTFTTGNNAATSNMLHVGNFKDATSCAAAGHAVVDGKHAGISGNGDFLFICVQANETGVTPP